MGYMNMNRPLYPLLGSGCDRWDCRDKCDWKECREHESWRMPLFSCDCGPRDCCGCSQSVRLENPCCPGECAEVTLSVDSCGNLVICVHKDPWKNDCRRPRKRC